MFAAALASGVAGPHVVGAAAQETPVFKARTEIVRLDVRITDSAGRPVADVRPEEIEILENGQRRPVVLFRHVAEAAGDEEGRGTAFQEVSANGGRTSGHMYVLVFDQAHITARNEQRVRQAAERFLMRTVKPNDAVAVYGLPGPGPVLGFTSDMTKARAGLAQVKGLAERPGGAGLREYDAYRLARADGQVAGDSVVERSMQSAYLASGESRGAMAPHVVAAADTLTHVFLRNLADALRAVRGIEGRKSVIVFSEGFFADNIASQLDDVAAAAALAQGVVYGIDLNRPLVGGNSLAEVVERRDAIGRLAAETSGLLFPAGADLDLSLATVAAQASDYYLVGFEPTSSTVAHDYRRVKVSVSRRGLQAHARSGYSKPPAATPQHDRQAIDAALTAPRTFSALPIEYTTYERGGPAPDKPRIIASITAHVPRVGAADRLAEVVFVVRDAVSGQAVASGTDHVRVRTLPGDAPAAMDLVPYAVQFEVPPGDYWMRVLVREPSGIIGTADRRFHVWPLTGPGIATSDLIVTKVEGQRFDAPTHARVSGNDKVLAYLEMYGCNETQPVDAKVEIVSTESNEVVATAEPDVRPAGKGGDRVLRARLPVELLKEGFYAARVRVAAANQAVRTVIRNFRLIAPAGKPQTRP